MFSFFIYFLVATKRKKKKSRLFSFFDREGDSRRGKNRLFFVSFRLALSLHARRRGDRGTGIHAREALAHHFELLKRSDEGRGTRKRGGGEETSNKREGNEE